MSTVRCDKCGEEYGIGDFPFCPHGKFTADNLAVVDDSVPGGFWVENCAKTPQKFYSKSEWRRFVKAQGLENRVKHVPVPGTDKSPHTQRFV